MKSVKVNIKFPSKSEAQVQLNNALKGLDSKLKIDLDLKSFNSSISAMSKELDNLKKKLDKFGVIEYIVKPNEVTKLKKEFEDLGRIAGSSLNIGDGSKGFKELQARANELKKTVSELSKIDYQLDEEGNLNKAIITYKDNVGNVVKETMEWRRIVDDINGAYVNVFETTKLGVADNVEKARKDAEKEEKRRIELERKLAATETELQAKLTEAYNNNLISPTALDNLQRKLNSINTDTPEGEIKRLTNEINNLSSSDSRIVKVQNAISGIENKIAGVKNKYGDLVKDDDIKETIIQLENLKKILDDLQNGKNVSKNRIDSIIGKGKSSLEQATLKIKESSAALKTGNQDAISFGEALKRSFANVGMYFSAASVIRTFTNELKNASQYLLELDERLTNIRMITGRSTYEINAITNEFKELGKQLHTTNLEMMAGAEEVLRAGYDMETAKDMLESSIIGAKISGQTTEAVTEQLIAIKNAFDLDGSQMSNVIDMISKMDNTSATSFKEIADAIQRTAYSAQQAGSPLENLVAYITTVSEKTRRSADTIGEAFKTIYSRYSNIKLGNVDDEGKSINDVEKALERVNIKLRDNTNSFRDFDDVLVEFAEKYKEGTMSQIDYLAVINTLGGTRQKETLMALVENFDAVKQHQDGIAESLGSAKDKFEGVYSDSLQAKIDDLKISLETLYETILNSSTLGAGIDALNALVVAITKVADTFGVLPTTIAGVVGAMTLLNAKFRESANIQMQSMFPAYGKWITNLGNLEQKLTSNIAAYTKNIKAGQEFSAMCKASGVSTQGLITQLVGLKLKLAASTAGMVAAKVATIALQAAASMGLSLAISAVVELLSKFVGKLFEARKSMNECSVEARDLSDALDGVKAGEDLISKYEEVKKLLDDTNLSAERRNQLEKELESIKGNLSTDDDYYWIINDENMGLERQLELLKQVREIKLRNMMQDLKDSLPSSTDMKNYQYEVETYVAAWSRAKEDLEAEKAKEDPNVHIIKQKEQAMAELEAKVKSSMLEIQKYNNSLDLITDETIRGTLQKMEFSAISQKLLEDFNKLTSAKTKVNEIGGTNTNGKASDALDEEAMYANILAEAYEKLGYSAEDANKRISDLKKLSEEDRAAEMIKDSTKVYGETTTEIENIRKIIKQIQDDGAMTYETVTQLASKYPEIGARITDSAAAQEFLNEKIKEQAQIQSEAYQIMIGDDVAYYNARLQNSNELQLAFNNFASNFIDVNSEAYTFDVKNYKTLNEAKAGLAGELNTALGQFLADMIGGNAEGYATELKNFQTLAEKKAEIINKLSDHLATLQRNQNNLFKYNEISSDGSGRTAGAKEYYDKLAAEIGKITGGMEKVDASFDEFNASFTGYTPAFSSGGAGSSSGSKKEVADLENLADRYYDLNNAIKQVENTLKSLKTLMENATEEEKIKLLQKEVDTLNAKKKALEALQKEQQKEASELKKELSSNGFNFDKYGNVTNAIDRLTQLTDQVNKLTGDSKEAAIAKVKALNETLKQYTDLLLDKIPDVADEIDDMKNEVIDAQKEIASILEEQRDKYIENLEKETDKLKSELNKRKELMEKSWKEEDAKDELSKKQKALNDLEDQLALAMRTADQELIKSIRLQIQEAQAEIDNFIRDNERENASNRFDDELNKADEDLQNKIDKITSQLSEEEILKLVQQGVTDLNSILNKIGSSTSTVKTAFASVGAIIENDWINSLDTFISKLGLIDTITPKIAFAADGVGGGAGNNNIVINSGGIVIQGNADSTTIGQIEQMLEENNKALIKELNACFAR